MLVVNLYGGPGATKSTVAAEVFAALKRRRIEVELPPEVAKLLTYRGDWRFLSDQLRVFAEQQHYLQMCRDRVQVALSDSPLLLSLVYMPPGYYREFEPMVRAVHDSFENMNFYIERPAHYSLVGRNQSHDEAKALDRKTREMLERHEVPHQVVRCDDAAEQIRAAVLRKLASDLLDPEDSLDLPARPQHRAPA